MGKQVNMVPSEEPVAVAITQTAKKVKAVKSPPCTPTFSASHTKPVEMFVALIMAENMPMISSSTPTGMASFAPS